MEGGIAVYTWQLLLILFFFLLSLSAFLASFFTLAGLPTDLIELADGHFHVLFTVVWLSNE